MYMTMNNDYNYYHLWQGLKYTIANNTYGDFKLTLSYIYKDESGMNYGKFLNINMEEVSPFANNSYMKIIGKRDYITFYTIPLFRDGLYETHLKLMYEGVVNEESVELVMTEDYKKTEKSIVSFQGNMTSNRSDMLQIVRRKYYHNKYGNNNLSTISYVIMYKK